ncbi:hypothetical protein AB0B21_28655 [Streptomyces rimosus]|uniref:nSTAND1 domain-containing NTPase n=1 Tax=Streptomyces rimosus TaxID=1927 RepID=UPI002D21CC00|nr:hypothetical protein [Streptomyces rimosus]
MSVHVLRQPRRQHTAGRPRAHDDEVECRHAALLRSVVTPARLRRAAIRYRSITVARREDYAPFDSVTVRVRNTADQAPYLGPARYETGDQDRFFGRDDLIQQLMVRVRERPLPVLAGPSGSGESSLLRAGLILPTCALRPPPAAPYAVGRRRSPAAAQRTPPLSRRPDRWPATV